MTSHLSSEATVELFQHYVIGNYKRYPVNLVRGEGSRVWDSEGKELLDLFPGWGCNLLGHCHPAIAEAVSRQVRELIHVPNTWHIEQQGRWAQLLSERSIKGKAFFCNSGAEANEAAIKLARLHGAPTRYKIITFEGGFHGRTMGALSATAQPKYHVGLGPMLPGFSYVPWGDLEAVAKRIDSETAAIMIEPIQGEGGVRIPSPQFLKGLRDLADQHGLLLILDEVQTGCGRTGHWFGYQYFGVQPDIITLAKSICGGIAGGAMLARSDIAEFLRPGLHASTFGGNPIAAAAGIAFLETVEKEELLSRATAIGERFTAGLQSLQQEIDYIREVRVAGVMVGIELEIDGASLVQSALENGLLINCTQGKVLRLLPALTISDSEIDRSLEILSEVLTTAGNTVASQSA
ncbi:MAG: Acetylornithine aminotransferase [Planctomycetota bacterium]|jgi:predicted acetylornithine/succinylornithine family transaminase